MRIHDSDHLGPIKGALQTALMQSRGFMNKLQVNTNEPHNF